MTDKPSKQKVIGLFNRSEVKVSEDRKVVDEEIVAALRDLLVLAEKGEIDGIVIVSKYAQPYIGDPRYDQTALGNLLNNGFSLIGALESVKLAVSQACEYADESD